MENLTNIILGLSEQLKGHIPSSMHLVYRGNEMVIAILFFSIPFALFFLSPRERNQYWKIKFVFITLFVFLCGINRASQAWLASADPPLIEALIKTLAAYMVITGLLVWGLYPHFAQLNELKRLKKEICELTTSLNYVTKREARLLFYEKILDHVNIGISIMKPSDLTTTYVNPQFGRMYGYANGECFGLSAISLIAENGKSPEEISNEIHETLIRNGEYSGELLRKRNDGSTFWAKLCVSSMDHPEFGKVYVAAHIDITERIKAQERIREQEATIVASARLAALGQMAAGIAHEINNPLAVISGHTEELLDIVRVRPVNASEVTFHLEKTAKMASRISTIIRSLRIFARDDRRLEFCPVSLSEVILDTLQLCKERFTNHSVRLGLDLPTSECLIECNATQISQVLLNLLNNAFDAVHELPNRWIELAVKEDLEEIEIHVRDSGSGISPAIRPQIMMPFFTTKEPGKGSGLGLSISKGFIESHRGQLTLDEKDSHTHFLIRLPRIQPTAIESAVLNPDALETRTSFLA